MATASSVASVRTKFCFTQTHTLRTGKKKSKPTVVSPRPCLIAPVPRRGAGAQGVAAQRLKRRAAKKEPVAGVKTDFPACFGGF